MRALSYKNDNFTYTEPFESLFTQGMVCHETYKSEKGKWLNSDEIEKISSGEIVVKNSKEKVIVGLSEAMSKSKKNTVDPEEMINTYGADSIRWFILADSPPERDVQWSIEGVSAAYKFIQKLWKLNLEIKNKKNASSNTDDIVLEKLVNKTIYNITKNLENFQYNVVVANVHEIYNVFIEKLASDRVSTNILNMSWNKIIMLLMPTIPHFAHECLGSAEKNFKWPAYNSKLLKDENCTIVIQVDGRKRGSFAMQVESKEDMVTEKAKANDNVAKYIGGKKIIKKIYIKNKLINFITEK